MASTVTLDADSADDLNSLLAEQRVELTAAQSLQSDLDFAFRLQFEEAISASLANLPSSSSAMSSQQYNQQQPPPQSETVVTSLSVLQEELTKTERELADGVQARLEMRKTREDLDRLVHDQLFVKELSTIPDDEWSEWGDEFENPYGQGRSTTVFNDDNCEFRLYFKGLVSQEKVRGKMASFSGIGVTICGPTDNVVFELKKPLIGDRMSKNAVEIKALIEGLNAALALELKRLRFFTDYYPLYQFITGRWPPKQRKIAVLVNQVYLLRRKFQSCNPVLVACNDLKYGLQLARDAIVCQATKAAESSHGKTVMETCVICLEDTDVENMFEVDGCLHRYCFSCMKRLVENKLLQALVPKCPHEGCKSELKVDSCRTFLTPKLLETYEQRIREASIPVMEKVYCPYPKCSALMTRSEVLKYAVKNGLFGGNSGTRKCLKCQHLFCVNCKVPWHENMSCYEYKRLNPNPPTEDVKLKSLASKNLWRQCVKCNHMIELSEGCFHMTCRCGYEFCYNCGAEWKNKKATCSCPLWDEDNIWFDDRDIDSDEEEVVGVELYESDSDEDWHPVGEEGEGQDLWVKERDDQDLREEEGDEDMSQEDDSDFPQDVDEKVDYDDYDDDLGGEEGGNQDLDEEEDQDLDEEEDDNDHDQDLDFSEEDDNDFPQDVDVGEKADYDENDSDDYDGDLDGREGKNQDLDEEEDRDLDEEEDENDHDQGLDFSEEDDYDDYDNDLGGDYDDEYW